VSSLDREVEGVDYDRVVEQTVEALARVYGMELNACPTVLWPGEFPQPAGW
jgi:hypothetical protein